MTDIKIYKKDGYFVGFECSGHTGYEEYGKDILCATVSGITQTVALGLRDVCKIKAKISRDDSEGYLKVELPKGLEMEKIRNAQILFETLVLAIKDLQKGYSQYISMEVIGNVY